MPTHKNDDLLRRSDQKFLVLLLTLAFVYFFGLFLGSPQYASSPVTPKLQLDLNTADEAELLLLPGIGATLAKRIIEYRTQNGPFKRNEDIINIRGIGPKKNEKILPLLREMTNDR